MAAADRRPVVHAPEERWILLGELLQLRRSELGYRRRPAFTREHDINIRLVTDIENAYRPNTFLTPTLREIAQAYVVTYESVVAVLNGKEDKLEPAAPAEAAPSRGLPAAPPSNLLREDASRETMVSIWSAIERLRVRGVLDPDGVPPSDFGRWSPSAAQLAAEIEAEPDPRRRYRMTADDARMWEASSGLRLSDRGWLVADTRARRQDPGTDGQAGASIA